MNDNLNEQAKPLAENLYVRELLDLLEDNGKSAAGVKAVISYVNKIENAVMLAESRVHDMQKQLDTMREIQNHPIKTKLQSVVKSLKSAIVSIREQLAGIKADIISGCKDAVTAFREQGTAALDRAASFLNIKSGLQIMKNSAVKGISDCDRAVADINAYAQEYHSANRHLKNMARIIVGKPPIDAKKEAGKLARALGAPARAEKSCLLAVKAGVDMAIGSLDKLERSADSIREKQPQGTLTAELAEGREKVRHRDLERQTQERTPVLQGAEI